MGLRQFLKEVSSQAAARPVKAMSDVSPESNALSRPKARHQRSVIQSCPCAGVLVCSVVLSSVLLWMCACPNFV